MFQDWQWYEIRLYHVSLAFQHLLEGYSERSENKDGEDGMEISRRECRNHLASCMQIN